MREGLILINLKMRLRYAALTSQTAKVSSLNGHIDKSSTSLSSPNQNQIIGEIVKVSRYSQSSIEPVACVIGWWWLRLPHDNLTAHHQFSDHWSVEGKTIMKSYCYKFFLQFYLQMCACLHDN